MDRPTKDEVEAALSSNGRADCNECSPGYPCDACVLADELRAVREGNERLLAANDLLDDTVGKLTIENSKLREECDNALQQGRAEGLAWKMKMRSGARGQRVDDAVQNVVNRRATWKDSRALANEVHELRRSIEALANQYDAEAMSLEYDVEYKARDVADNHADELRALLKPCASSEPDTAPISTPDGHDR